MIPMHSLPHKPWKTGGLALLVVVLIGSFLRAMNRDDSSPVQSSEKSDASVWLDPQEFHLDEITDRARMSDVEIDAMDAILDHVRHVPRDQLQTAAQEFLEKRWKQSPYKNWPLEKFPLFVDMMDMKTHPNPKRNVYRGQPVTLKGHLRLHHVTHVENDYGLDPIHEAYLYTSDSQTFPAIIFFTENPDNIPVGANVISNVTVTGYFFKLRIYKTQGGKISYSPLILAREARWHPPLERKMSKTVKIAIGSTITFLIVTIVWAMIRIRKSDAAARAKERELLDQETPPTFDELT